MKIRAYRQPPQRVLFGFDWYIHKDCEKYLDVHIGFWNILIEWDVTK
jgi:hypothetical protein